MKDKILGILDDYVVGDIDSESKRFNNILKEEIITIIDDYINNNKRSK